MPSVFFHFKLRLRNIAMPGSYTTVTFALDHGVQRFLTYLMGIDLSQNEPQIHKHCRYRIQLIGRWYRKMMLVQACLVFRWRVYGDFFFAIDRDRLFPGVCLTTDFHFCCVSVHDLAIALGD